jgi:hypothetical protein
MKKFALIALVTLVCLSAAVADPAPYGGSGAFVAGPSEAMVILNQLGLYTENGGTLTLKEGLVIGDKLTLLNKSQKFKMDKVEKDFIKVRSPSGTEGWVRAPYALSKVSLAVVKVDPSTIYSQPRDVSVTAKTISKMTLVAVFQDGSSGQWAKVNCYDSAQDIYYTEADNVFLPREDLTFSDADISAVIIYTTAMANKNKTIRANLFKVVDKKYSSSVFYDQIKATLAPETVVANTKPTSPAVGIYTVNDNNVNVRNSPDEVNGAVSGTLNKGTDVEVFETTTQSYTIGGLTAPWFHIREPSGWVFGAFISVKP